MDDWNLLRSLLAVVDHGSLVGAARALRSTQPTVGRQIALLESRCGLLLFERSGRGLKPTAEALRLAQLARPMEQAAAAVGLAARGAGGASAGGTVRVSASQPVACHLLPPLLAQLRLLEPQIRIDLVVSNAVSNLLRGDADIALRMVQPQQADLVVRKLGEVHLGAYAHADYLRRCGTPRQLADLGSHALIADDAAGAVLQGLRRAGLQVDAERFVLRTDDLIAYWQALRAGLGIGFVSTYLARSDPQVLPVLPEIRIDPLPMWLVVHRELRGNRIVRRVFDFLAREVPRAL